MDEEGRLTLPPNCTFSNDAMDRIKEMAVMVLNEMADRRLPLSPALYAQSAGTLQSGGGDQEVEGWQAVAEAPCQELGGGERGERGGGELGRERGGSERGENTARESCGPVGSEEGVEVVMDVTVDPQQSEYTLVRMKMRRYESASRDAAFLRFAIGAPPEDASSEPDADDGVKWCRRKRCIEKRQHCCTQSARIVELERQLRDEQASSRRQPASPETQALFVRWAADLDALHVQLKSFRLSANNARAEWRKACKVDAAMLAVNERDEQIKKLKETVSQLERKLAAQQRSGQVAVSSLAQKRNADVAAVLSDVKRLRAESAVAKELAGVACARFEEESVLAEKLSAQGAVMLKENVAMNKRCVAAKKKAAKVLELERRVAAEKARVKEEKERVAIEQSKAKKLDSDMKFLVKQQQQSEQDLAAVNKEFDITNNMVESMQAELAVLRELEHAAALPMAHTDEKFEQLSYNGRASARHRDMKCLNQFLSCRKWRAADISTVLDRLGYLTGIWEGKEIWRARMEWGRELFGMCQSHHWGVRLGLHLALTQHMTTRQIRLIGQLSCMQFDSESNSYRRKVLLYNPHLASDFLVVPRILPPPEKFQPELTELSNAHGFKMSENGKLSFQSLRSQLSDMLVETAQLLGVQQDAFTSDRPLPACIQLDAARRRSRQFLMPVVLKNPSLDSQSCSSLRVLALGVGMKDDRAGTQQLLMPNMDEIEEMLQLHSILLQPADAGAAAIRVAVNLKFTADFAGIRAIEGSLCGCAAMVIHAVPVRAMVDSVQALRKTCATCDNCTPSRLRWIRTHTPLAGKDLPEPCDMCSFASDGTTAGAELEAFTNRLSELEGSSHTAAGKTALANFVRGHKLKHANTGPGPNATPLTSARLVDWILDLLHVDLNLGKLTWKWALVRRLPAETREAISRLLASYGHSLDLRTKEEGRQSQDKFYDGGEWQSFINGGTKAPSGQIIIAEAVRIVADHYDQVAAAHAEAQQRVPPAPANSASTSTSAVPRRHESSKPTRKNRGGAIDYAVGGQAAQQAADKKKEVELPWKAAFEAAQKEARTEVEVNACQTSLSKIRHRYGESGESLIAMLLCFDALFAFRVVFRTRIAPSGKESHAVAFAVAHRAWYEQLERVSVGQHKSYYPHRTQLTGPAQILEVGDLWDYSLSSLESFHAEVGRVADRTGCKRKETDAGGELTRSTRVVKTTDKDGNELDQLVESEYKSSTTMCSSIASRLLAHQSLRKDEEMRIDCRATHRIQLAPEKGGGRVSLKRWSLKTGKGQDTVVKTCLQAFADLI